MLLVSCLPCLILPRTNPPPPPPFPRVSWSSASHRQLCLNKEESVAQWRASESKSDNLGSRPGDVVFETNQFCRTSSTFVKVCRKSSIFLVKSSAGMSKTLFDTCVNWSCVTRCGCRTISSTLFTVCRPPKLWGIKQILVLIGFKLWIYFENSDLN
jgi:hypothetical protein